MRRRWIVVAVAFALAACGDKRADGPREYLDSVKPGGDTFKATLRVGRLPQNVFPAGRLEGLDIRGLSIREPATQRLTLQRETAVVFGYSMLFNVGRDDVLSILDEELGERLGTGAPPIHTTWMFAGDFWQTEEGWWVCGDNRVTWYSNPFPVVPRRGEEGYDPNRVQQLSRPAPASAALWNKIGRMLIGLDTDPRPTLPSHCTYQRPCRFE